MTNTENLIRLRPIMLELNSKGFHIEYLNIVQALKQDRLPIEIAKFIQVKKNLSSSSYFIKESEVEKFKEVLLKQFN